MKKVVKGKLYNTETATLVDSWRLFDEYEAFELIEELYRKKTGEFFITRCFCGEGSDENIVRSQWVQEHILEPLTEKDARKWVEEHLDADSYIELFGEPEE